MNPEGAEKTGSGGGACPPELVNRDAFSKRSPLGGGGGCPPRAISSGRMSRDSADRSSST